jgi:hypothetical protein
MFINPADLRRTPDRLEEIEKASTRLVAQAIFEIREEAARIFAVEKDLAQDIAEDLTREALDKLGVSRMDLRLFGKIDYKRARYLFHPDYAVRQALLVDSKAEKEHGTATLQTAQTSLHIRHIRATVPVDILGTLPSVIQSDKGDCITTSIIVKYEYTNAPTNALVGITVAAIPNGFLQDKYNPTVAQTIWRAGRNAPTLREGFRVRLVFQKLKDITRWRVQDIAVPVSGRQPPRPSTPPSFHWDE